MLRKTKTRNCKIAALGRLCVCSFLLFDAFFHSLRSYHAKPDMIPENCESKENENKDGRVEFQKGGGSQKVAVLYIVPQSSTANFFF